MHTSEDNNQQQLHNLHGNLLYAHGLGVLVTGESNIGKSELSLALIDRGHQLVSDDCVELSLDKQQVIGKSPELSYGFMQINGLGVINIAKLYGEKALKSSAAIELVIHLVKESQLPPAQNPLTPIHHKQVLLGLSIHTIIFPASIGKSLHVLLDTLIANHKLYLQGYNSSKEFSQRQHHKMHEDK